MQTKVSTKGQVVVPNRIRRKLNLQPGDLLDAKLEGSNIVLTPRKARPRGARIIQDPITGLPVLTASSPNAPKLTSKQVDELLADFP
jgi:AbrB family looped-hinge helix DNA binding protein